MEPPFVTIQMQLNPGLEGYDGNFVLHNLPPGSKYTIIQQIDRYIKRDITPPRRKKKPTGFPDTNAKKRKRNIEIDSDTFTESWQGVVGQQAQVDSFTVPRYWRQQAKGELKVRAYAWLVEGHVAAELGMKRGVQGREPWGTTFGTQKLYEPASGTLVFDRKVKIRWNNLTKKLEKQYTGGKDLKIEQ